MAAVGVERWLAVSGGGYQSMQRTLPMHKYFTGGYDVWCEHLLQAGVGLCCILRLGLGARCTGS